MRRLLFALIAGFLSFVSAQAQTEITGKVTDIKDGLPLAGVSVRLKGSSSGVQTDVNGEFRLSVTGKDKVLVISYVGYAPEEINLGTRSRVTVSLSTEERKLTEVVVTAYGSQEKKKITGSVAKVDGKEFESIPMPSFDQMLQGKVAGVQSVSASGQPGALQQIRIRGIGSLLASSEPLYVVDGVPLNTGDFSRNTTTSNALAGLDPNDIESISVLKDASAATLYGSRAANGVILVTTRKGRSGKTKIGVNAEYGFNNAAFLNNDGKPLSWDQYATITREGLLNAGLDTAQTSGFMDQLGYNNGFKTTWFDHVLRQGISQQYNVSASGGDAKTTFYASGNYFKQTAVIIASDFTRFTGNLNIHHQASNRVGLNFTLNASHYDQTSPNQSAFFRSPVLAAFFLNPFQHPFNKDGSIDYSTNDFGQIYNPVAIAKYDRQTLGNTKFLGTGAIEYSILKGLKFTSRIGLDYFNLEEITYENPFFGDAVTTNGSLTNFYTRVFNYVWTNTLDYHKDIDKNGDLSMDLKLGYEAQKSKEYDLSSNGTGVPLVTSLVLPVTSSPKQASAGGSDYAFSSGFSNLQFNYKNKYSLSGSFRRDGSSRFGSNQQYGNFWSVGGAWNLDREDFLVGSKVISTLKLRASYGINGNAGIGNYTWRPTYGFGGVGTDYNQNIGSGPTNVGNPNLTWEQNKPLDIGLELGVIRNRFNLEFDYYDRKTSHLLENVPLSLTSGFGSYTANIGAMENKGFEITLNLTPVLTRDFRWDVNFNIALNKNKVTSLDQGADIINGTNIIRVGQDVQSVYTFIYAGVDPASGSAQWYTDGTKKTKTTDVTQVQNAIVGTSSPKGFGGLTTTLTYKNLSLSGQFNFQYGNLLYNQWGFLSESDGAFFTLNQDQAELRRWQKPGDKTDVPQYVAGNSSNSNTTSTRYFYKGDYVRLRNLTLSYSIPKRILAHIKTDNILFYVRGTNLWTKATDKHLTFDPEQPINGTNDLQILSQKTISFGLNLGF
jgi:TonB-linked SusC/RagA family outer membrane protein